MEDAGYSPKTAVHPKEKLFKAKGFQELLNESGLTDEFLNKCLYTDIKQKKGNRKQELELAYRLKGRLKETKETHRVLIELD